METSKGNASKRINFERGAGANLRGGVPGGSWRRGESAWQCQPERGEMTDSSARGRWRDWRGGVTARETGPGRLDQH